MSRVKLTLEGLEKDDDEEGQDKTSPTVPQKMANTVEFSLISNEDYKCRHSQPDCGYALQPDRWIEYTIQTMEPDNLELIFDFFEVCLFTPKKQLQSAFWSSVVVKISQLKRTNCLMFFIFWIYLHKCETTDSQPIVERFL